MESISKKELSRDLQSFKCDISTLQRTVDNLRRRIDRLPDDPPKHEWKKGEWLWCGHLKTTVQHTGEKEFILDDLDVPIPTPHEIGTWIHFGETSFYIGYREWNTNENDWFYAEREQGVRMAMFHRHATVIPPPQFEVGEMVKSTPRTWEGEVYKITRREWESERNQWIYFGSPLGGYDPEKYLTLVPVHEWKVDEWFFDKDRNAIYQINEIIPNNKLESRASDSFRWHDKSNCVPVHFIQFEGGPIREGSIVRTPDGWIGSVMCKEHSGINWFVQGHGQNIPCGWFSPSKLTLCAPEVK